MPLRLHDTPIPGLRYADVERLGDSRGAFARLFCDRELEPALGTRRIVQINLSRTVRVGAIRGLHYQWPPHAEMKLVRCLRGAVWDVSVDLRRGSATFLHWHAETLSGENGRMMIIPEGFAHGFQVLSPDSELLYLHTAHYTPASEGGISFREPRLAIGWPMPESDVSARDADHPALGTDFEGVEVP